MDAIRRVHPPNPSGALDAVEPVAKSVQPQHRLAVVRLFRGDEAAALDLERGEPLSDLAQVRCETVEFQIQPVKLLAKVIQDFRHQSAVPAHAATANAFGGSQRTCCPLSSIWMVICVARVIIM
jgi:hypothetical protein